FPGPPCGSRPYFGCARAVPPRQAASPAGDDGPSGELIGGPVGRVGVPGSGLGRGEVARRLDQVVVAVHARAARAIGDLLYFVLSAADRAPEPHGRRRFGLLDAPDVLGEREILELLDALRVSFARVKWGS